jgi:hypothetical protein
MNVLISLHSNF